MTGSKARAPLTQADLRRARQELVRMHHRSRVGHLGGNLSAIDAMLVLHHEVMGGNDRFVLSKGHSAGALYVTLWTLGRLSDQALETFHRDGTRLAGHPPARGIADIRFATGSLGHGLSLAAGCGIAGRIRRDERRVFCLTSDGEWEEGSTWEALMFIAHHRLDRLVVVVDGNGLQGFGRTAEVASLDPIEDKLRAFNVDVRIADGHDLGSMRKAFSDFGLKPTVVVLRTRKGHGVSFLQDRMESHYLPLTDDQCRQALAELENS